MYGATKILAVLSLLATTAWPGCPTFHEERTRIHRLVGFRYQMERSGGTLSAQRFFTVVAIDKDAKLLEMAMAADYGTNGYEPLSTSTNGIQDYKDQIRAKMLAEGDYDPDTQHLYFHQTTDVVDWNEVFGLRVTIDVLDASPDQHGIDPGDELTLGLTNQTDLDDGSGEAEDYGSATDQLVPVSDFDTDEDGDVDLMDYAEFEQALTGPSE